VKTTDGGRRAAVEIMLGTHTIRDMIKRGEFGSLKEVMEKSKALGMVTFDSALFDLVVEGVIEEEEAVKNADSANNLRLKIKLWKEKGQIASSSDATGWSLEPTKDEKNDHF
ncbi:MAG: type IVa pilus ATPase TapW, partial [Aeromonas sobria]